MDEMEQYQNQMDPRCRKEMPDRPAPVYQAEDYVQSTVTDPMSHQQQYGENSRSRSRSPLRHKSSTPDQEGPSTLKKQKLQVQAISEEEYGEEGTSQYEGEEGYTESKLRDRSSKYEYAGEESMSMSQSVQRSQNPGALENRLE
jgi:hypothetical protein